MKRSTHQSCWGNPQNKISCVLLYRQWGHTLGPSIVGDWRPWAGKLRKWTYATYICVQSLHWMKHPSVSLSLYMFAIIMFLMLLMNIVYLVCFDKFLMLLACSIWKSKCVILWACFSYFHFVSYVSCLFYVSVCFLRFLYAEHVPDGSHTTVCVW